MLSILSVSTCRYFLTSCMVNYCPQYTIVWMCLQAGGSVEGEDIDILIYLLCFIGFGATYYIECSVVRRVVQL